jgi:hypothetical protein
MGLRGLLAGLALICSIGAIAMAFTNKPSGPVLAPPVQRQLVPSSSDRLQVTPEQARLAYAAGLVDRPIKSILNIKRSMSYGEFFWNEKGVPSGPVWIRVDLNSQLLSVFRSGHEIGTAVILYGADQKETPTGRFPILAKLKNHRSSLYDASMPYTLRITGDGVSIHGSDVRRGFATHGCIGVPAEFAAKLFEVVSKGDEVFIVDSKARRTA